MATIRYNIVLQILTALAVAGGMSACTKEIKMNIKDRPPVLVANALVQAGEHWDVELTASQFILNSDDIQHIDNAVMTVTDAGGTVSQMKNMGNGRYRDTSATVVGGQAYTFSVQHSTYPSVSATAAVPVPAVIDTVEVAGWLVEINTNFVRIRIKFTDPLGENYYRIIAETKYDAIFYRDSLLPDGSWTVIKDSLYNGFGQDAFLPLYYRFEETSPYRDMLAGCFNDQLFDGAVASVDIILDSYQFDGGYSESDDVIIRLESLSKDYFLYVSSSDAYSSANGNPFAQPVQVHSNVTGGIGIVAGHSISAPHTVYVTPK